MNENLHHHGCAIGNIHHAIYLIKHGANVFLNDYVNYVLIIYFKSLINLFIYLI